MSLQTLRQEKGFTIVEVVLVLAIAGLIFLIVFLALPQLQRSRRDTQRKSDVGRMLSSLESYAGNNDGNYPAESTAAGNANFGTYGAANSFWAVYANADGTQVDPNGGNFTISFPATAPNATALATGTVGYWLGVDCQGNAAARNIAISIGLEQGNYCQDNR
jgi:prepilin-type N-terminal cleavage/methylation domain-containing protein